MEQDCGLCGVYVGVCLLCPAAQVVVPAVGLWAGAPAAAAVGTVLAAGSAALASAMGMATTGVVGGGGTNLMRSVGHTQFLAMSVSLAVPGLPPEYTQLCSGAM